MIKVKATDGLEKGYVLIWRKLLDTGLQRDHKLFVVLMWCILKATHRDMEIAGRKLSSGQFITGEHVASKELNMKGSTFRYKLRRLKDLGIITTKVVGNSTVVSVCKYKTYQNLKLDKAPDVATYNTHTIHNNINKPLRRIKKPSFVETTPLLTYFCNKYEDTFGKRYLLSRASDGASIKRLLQAGLTFSTLKNAIDRYLDDTDRWITDKGHPISIFASGKFINRYVIAEQQPVLDTYVPPEKRKVTPMPDWVSKRIAEKERERGETKRRNNTNDKGNST